MNLHQAIRRMGLLRAAVSTWQAHGARVNPAWISEMNQIETWARGSLTPQQLGFTGRMVDQFTSRFIGAAERLIKSRAQANQTQWENWAERKMEGRVRDMTRGMLGQVNGLTRDQLQLLAQGKPVPRNTKPRLSQAGRDAEWRAATKQYDPAGRGWSEAETAALLDKAADATPDQLADMNKRNGVGITRDGAEKWKRDRIGVELAARRRAADERRGLKSTQDVTAREPTSRERRRAMLTEGYLNLWGDQVEKDLKEGKDAHHSDAWREAVDAAPAYMREEKDPDGRPTRRAHLAHAMDEALVESGDAE